MKYYLYLAWYEDGWKIYYTHRPELDFAYLQSEGYGGVELLSPPVSLAVAHYLWKQAGGCNGGTGNGSGGWRKLLGMFRGPGKEKSIAEIIAEKQVTVSKMLRRMGFAVLADCVDRDMLPPGDVVLPAPIDLQKIRDLCAGRFLFVEEITRAAEERNIRISQAPEGILQVLALQNRVRVLPSVEITRPGEWRCLRCGQQAAVKTAPCPVCGLDRCPYCEGCVNMGGARGCRPVYAVQGGAGDPGPGEAGNPASGLIHHGCAVREPVSEASVSIPAPGDFSLRFELTPPQEKAARQLEQFVLTDPRPEVLIWACCGAGKTEVTFPAIRSVLNRGGRVLLAIPRRDVVLELAPRIREAFPLARVTAVYGGCAEKFAAADITIATTHQALRFNGHFDLVILDEADAYPYQGSAMLRLAVERAGKPGGKRVFMTATPDERLYADARNGHTGLITIPARFHGFPLPEPKIQRDRTINQKDDGREINPVIIDWLLEKHHRDGGQVFIFVPTVKLCCETGAALQRALAPMSPGGKPQNLCNNPAGKLPVLEYSYAADPERDKKREGFKRGDFPFFLSTTIMERGITVANAHVLVLFADYARVFDEGALIQMSGRAGRSAPFPAGEVAFIGENITPAMRGAVEKIRLLNREAAARGYFI